MMRPPGIVLAQGSKMWPSRAQDFPQNIGLVAVVDDNGIPLLNPQQIQQMYEQGFAGAYGNPTQRQKLKDYVEATGGNFSGAAIHNAGIPGFAGAGEGKLTILFPYVEKLYPGCFPGAAQQRGDCVSHSTMKGASTTFCCDVAAGKPDEVSGIVEGAPEVSETGIKNGAFSSEIFYWYRGYNGDGWDCGTAAHVSLNKCGALPRNSYPELGIDLQKYSGSLAGKYGSNAPPDSITQFGQKHLIRTVTELNGYEQVRDFLANGYGISTCGGEGWSSQRDENGFSKRQGGWSHAMPFYGCDDRPEIKQKYGDQLILISNNWGAWNSGGTRILGTQIDIPPGFFWARWQDVKNREILAFSGANGWPAKTLPPIHIDVG